MVLELSMEDEIIFDSNHPVNVTVEPDPIIELPPELEQKIEPGEIVKIIEPKRTIHCELCGKDINCKNEKFDKKILYLHQHNKRLCPNSIPKEIKTAPIA